MKKMANAITKKALDSMQAQPPTDPSQQYPTKEVIENELLLLIRAEIRLYWGKRPTLDQMQRFEEKINKIAFEKFKTDYKLKTRYEEKVLKKRMEELQMLESYSRKKRMAIEEELKKANGGGI